MHRLHFNLSRPLKAMSMCLPLLVTTGCGGGDARNDTSSGSIGQSNKITYAQWELLGEAPDKLISRPTGIYGLRRTSGSADKIVKWQRTPGAVGWLEMALPTTSTVFAPADVGSTSGIQVNWAGFRASDVRQIYAYLNAPAFDDIGITSIVANNGNSSRQWVITRAGAVWYKSSGGGLGTNASVIFDKIRDTGLSYLGQNSSTAVADGTGILYASSGSTLARVTLSKELSTWSMPDRVNTLVWAANTLWIGAGDKVYRLSGDSVQHYATLSGGLVGISAIAPTFCVSNDNLYGANGMVYRSISAGSSAPTPASYVKSGSQVDASSYMASQITSGAFAGAGVYCSDNIDQFVFTILVDQSVVGQLVKIRPL